MEFELFSDLGGYLWWLFIKFRKTDLKKEQSQEKRARNLFFLIVLAYLIAFFTLKIF